MRTVATKISLLSTIIFVVVVSAFISKAVILPEPPPDEVVLGEVLDHYAGRMDPPLKDGEVIIVSRKGRGPWLKEDWYNERDAATIVNSWTQLGASAQLVEEIKRDTAPSPKWEPALWTCRTPIRDDKTFSDNWGGLETMRECLEKGGPARTVLHFSKPYLDSRTGRLFVVLHDWSWPLSTDYTLYKLEVGDGGWKITGEANYQLAGF